MKKRRVWERLSLKKSSIFVYLLVLSLIMGSILRLYGLGDRSLWMDEMITAHWAGENISYIFSNEMRPFHYTVLRLFSYLVPLNEFTLRVPGMIFGILGILIIYKIARLFFGQKEGIISAFLLSVSPTHIVFSRDARFYPGLILFSLLTLFFLYKALEEDDKKSWVGFIVFTVLNLYNHPSAFFVLLSEILFSAYSLGRGYITRLKASSTYPTGAIKARALWLIHSLIIVLLCYLPKIGILSAFSSPEEAFHGAPRGFRLGSVRFFADIFGIESGVPLYLFGAALLLGLFSSLKRYRTPLILALLWMAVPFFILQYFMKMYNPASKYLLFLLPVWLIFIAKGVTSVGQMVNWLGRHRAITKNRFLVFCALVVTLILGGVSIQKIPPIYQYHDYNWRAMVNYLKENLKANDVIIHVRRPDTYSQWAEASLRGYYLDKTFLEMIKWRSVTTVSDLQSATYRYENSNLWVVFAWRSYRPREVLNWIDQNIKLVKKNFGQVTFGYLDLFYVLGRTVRLAPNAKTYPFSDAEEGRTGKYLRPGERIDQEFVFQEGGRYLLRVDALRQGEHPRGLKVRLDGEFLGMLSFEGRQNALSFSGLDFSVEAGHHLLSLSLTKDFAVDSEASFGKEGLFIDRVVIGKVDEVGFDLQDGAVVGFGKSFSNIIFFRPGTIYFQITARGIPVSKNIWPRMVVELDHKTILDAVVDSTGWQVFTTEKLSFSTKNFHLLTIKFFPDEHDQEKERYLYLQKVRIQRGRK